jgi:GDP-4-dehydro-6-deoxy-D-mannose reductase
MRALVTGIAGFAGNYLAQLLLREGFDVFGISQEKEFKPFLAVDAAAVHYTALDIRDRSRTAEVLAGIRPDLVFHLAARSSPSQSLEGPRDTYEINFGGTLALLDAVRTHKLPSRFLLVSSSHVYGAGDGVTLLSEESKLRPGTPYAGSKAAAEMAASQYWESYGVETVRVRAFNHTGPGQKEGFVCPDLARKVVEIERGYRPPRLEVADLDRCLDFSDVCDIVSGYYNALTRGKPGEVYNLCSGKPTTVRTIAEGFIACSGRAISLRPCHPKNPAAANRGVLGDNSRALRELGWQPSILFRETLKDVLEFWRKHDWACCSSHDLNAGASGKKDACST